MGATSSKANVTESIGKKRARSLTPSEEHHSPVKKHKDGQRAKSGSLQIPVDETCPLAGKISGCKLF